MKRIEIVTDTLEVNRLLEILESVGVSGYTVIRDVTGKGGRGARAGDGLTDVFKNSYVLTACNEEQARRIVDAIRPALKKYGGLCLVGDAEWVVH